jgi:ABC-type transport system involved in multi-copper enzyme maturation permease subunit
MSNILSLIKKDFCALMSEKIMGIMFIILLLMSAMLASLVNFSSLIFLFLVIYAYIQNLFSLDEKYRTEKYYASLPVRRNEMVFARYGGVAAIPAIYLIIAYLANRGFIFFHLKEAQPLPAGYIVLVFLILAFLTSFTLPFYFRFGISKAKGVSVILFMVIGALMSIMFSLARIRGTGISNQVGFIFYQEIITSVMLFGCAVLLLAISVPLTLALYSRKDL